MQSSTTFIGTVHCFGMGVEGGLSVCPWGGPTAYVVGCKVRAWLLSASNSRCTKSVSAFRISTCRMEGVEMDPQSPPPPARPHPTIYGAEQRHNPTTTHCGGAFSPQALQEGSDTEGLPHNHCDPLWDGISAPTDTSQWFFVPFPPPPPEQLTFPTRGT